MYIFTQDVIASAGEAIPIQKKIASGILPSQRRKSKIKL